MSEIGLISLALVFALISVLIMGLPLAFTLGGIGVIFLFLLSGHQALNMIIFRTYGLMQSFILIAGPLFIFMGAIIEQSGLGDRLYETMQNWMGGLRGGLAMGTILICALFAAMTGVSATATVTMGIIALPAMLRRGYDSRLAVGSISAGGALGVLIPPSVIMIIYALMAEESVGGLFAGGLFPGLVLVVLFILYIGIRAHFQPKLAPVVPSEERVGWRMKFVSLRGVILPICIVIAVLGSIFAGIASPSEAAAVGAFGAILSALIYRTLSWKILKDSTIRTLKLTCLLMWIIIGASAFTGVYSYLGASSLIQEIVQELEVNRWIILAAIQSTYFILGMFLEATGILMLTMPIYLPLIKALEFNTLWFGVLFVMNMEMGFLTPPFGFNLFYMKAIVPKSITMGDIYRSIVPFVLLQAIGLVVVIIFPEIALWLPRLLFGSA
ncbi:TRAP transporter large permease subunit [Chloroflexota bacterium]